MRTDRIALFALISFCTLTAAAAQTPQATGENRPPHPPHDASSAHAPGTPPPTLIGSWKSAPDETPLTTDLQKSVWGPNAKSVRVVDLVLLPSGAGTLTVTTKVVDGKGKTAPASTTIETAKLTLGGPQETIGGVRTEYEVKVSSAERKYPDDPSATWPLEGLKVKVATIEGAPPNTIEIRFDTPEGRGSFWETLTKGRAAPAKRS